MLVFDGHNDLLLNLWLYHRDAPAEAFFAGVPKGHLDFSRMQQGGFAGGLFALLYRRRTTLLRSPRRVRRKKPMSH